MSIGPVSSASRYSAQLRSINLRPITRGPEIGSGSANQGTSQSSNSSDASPESGSTESSNSVGNETTGSNSGPSSDPKRRFTLIGGQGGQSESSSGQGSQTDGSSGTDGPVSGDSQSSGPTDSTELSPSERRKVQELKRIDAKVRAHEQAHLAAAGQYAQGGISFETKTGPDGKEYAVAGEVSLDTSKADTPQKTIQKMRQVKAAALAPAEPSPQDRSIAAQASRKLNQARQKLQGEETGQQPAAATATNGPSDSSPTGFERASDFGASSSDSDEAGQAVAASGNSVNQYLTGSSSNSAQQPGRALNVLA